MNLLPLTVPGPKMWAANFSIKKTWYSCKELPGGRIMIFSNGAAIPNPSETVLARAQKALVARKKQAGTKAA